MAKILVAEDEKDIGDLVLFTLQYGGHETTLVGDGAAVVDQAPIVKPDMIILDMHMPKLSGVDACRKLKTIDEVKHIPVVFLSGDSGDEEKQQVLDAGAVGLIVKPFSPDDLVNQINELLSQAKKNES